jgi:hypothetical protein
MNRQNNDKVELIFTETLPSPFEDEISLANEEYNINPDLGKPFDEVFHSLRKEILTQYYVQKAI